ncbi:TerD family protein [Streptomyces sp. NPDC001584]|uniref:TerD family protein n=1 Tax=Streptomyces sp. NPDC001584 TaxID=3154521 RepID=UPI00332F2831
MLLAKDGKVRGDDDLVFYNRPAQDGVVLGGRTIVADLSAVPATVDRIAIVAGIDGTRAWRVWRRPSASWPADSRPRARTRTSTTTS